ncbi:hypothetical protein, conserved [Trypanosoma brucei gambiense DAL972]|uniref:Uncharacterized protein n=1 Tax=Trypanosoma brucei gambiense (strain MHOM/CI/86/DAL972) TaxID=679716 RepID=C9ZZ42_TRYB9|nr:hypothetical protein, conserved [Trypanosoma brucei gambiense DAL972]CBH14691.1 hypothetical protein, conserved [Trypanosoma brucei gambiense DAL972]|eukprot:XP_011776957.1 hypothetical protein, conserved [Trypanosoma brucei gambiense DAL972]
MQAACTSRSVAVLGKLASKGVGVLLLLAIFRRWRKSQRADSIKKHFQEENEVKDTGCMTSALSYLPIYINTDKLPENMLVGAPLFYPPQMAVLPLSWTDAVGFERSCFITCEGPFPHMTANGKDPHDMSFFFLQYMQRVPFMQSTAERGLPIKQLQDVGLLCCTDAFSHIVTDPAERVVVIFGRNGPYFTSLVITPCTMPEKNVVGNMQQANQISLQDLQKLLDACCPTPLVDEIRLAGTSAGTLQGKLHIACRYGNRVVQFTAASALTVRSARDNEDFIFSLEGDVLAQNRIVFDAATIDALISGKTLDELFSCPGPQCMRVSSLVQLIHMEDLTEISHNLGNGASNGDVTREINLKVSGSRLLLSAGEVSVVFHHAHLGVHFPINSHHGVICEPVLTTDLCLMYYPLGSAAALPNAMMRRVRQLPPTWERSLHTDDALRHNALFHFTDWMRGSVPCITCDLSGFRCAQLYEEKDGMSCRTYVVPLAEEIMVLRWETSTCDWEQHLPHLQKFIDTLHLEVPTA